MAVIKTIQIGDPRLKNDNKNITDPKDPMITSLIQDLKDTMHENGLIGIAAPQIGENYKRVLPSLIKNYVTFSASLQLN